MQLPIENRSGTININYAHHSFSKLRTPNTLFVWTVGLEPLS